MLKCAMVVLAVTIFCLLSTPGNAQITFSGSGTGNDPGETLSASVQFALSISGTTTNLVLTLTNTTTNAPNDPADMLAAVFFDIPGTPTLSRVSGVLGFGSAILGASTPTNGVIGGEWAYADGFIGAPHAAKEGVSAVGFGQFGPPDLFPGPALPKDGGNPPDGVAYTITTANDTGSQWNGGLNKRAFVQNSAVFTLGNVPASFTLSQISNVSFQYGTTLTEPDIVGVPEPSSIALAACGLLVLILLKPKRKWNAPRSTKPNP